MTACASCGSTGDWSCIDCVNGPPTPAPAHNRIYTTNEERKAEHARRARERYQAKKDRRPVPDRSLERRETTLYRIFGANGELLYVGITHQFDERLKQHRRYSSWASLIHHWQIETYPNRRRAKRVETLVIRGEMPVFNRHESTSRDG